MSLLFLWREAFPVSNRQGMNTGSLHFPSRGRLKRRPLDYPSLPELCRSGLLTAMIYTTIAVRRPLLHTLIDAYIQAEFRPESHHFPWRANLDGPTHRSRASLRSAMYVRPSPPAHRSRASLRSAMYVRPWTQKNVGAASRLHPPVFIHGPSAGPHGEALLHPQQTEHAVAVTRR